MNEKYLVYKVTSWVQDRPWLMLLAGIGCLTGLFHEFTRYQAAACLVSGLINLTTGLAPRYQRLTVGKIVSVGHLLSVIGFWSLLIGFANLDGSTVTTHAEVLEAGKVIVPKLKLIILNVLSQL